MMSHHHLEISTPTLEWPVPEPHEKYQIDPKNIHGFYALLGLFALLAFLVSLCFVNLPGFPCFIQS